MLSTELQARQQLLVKSIGRDLSHFVYENLGERGGNVF